MSRFVLSPRSHRAAIADVYIKGISRPSPDQQAGRDRRKRLAPMPLVDALKPQAVALHTELRNRYLSSSGGIDFFFYNWGTGIALAATGAAGVFAAARLPIWAASASAVSAFFIAMTRMLGFGKRWTWNLGRRAIYARMIYELNALELVDEAARPAAIAELYARLGEERQQDAHVPGVNDEATANARHQGTSDSKDPSIRRP
jgi:hypothetical protein